MKSKWSKGRRSVRLWDPDSLTDDEWAMVQELDTGRLSGATLAVIRTRGPRWVARLVARASGKPPRELSRAERARGTRGDTRRTRHPVKGQPDKPNRPERRLARRALWHVQQDSHQETRRHAIAVHNRAMRRIAFRKHLRKVGL